MQLSDNIQRSKSRRVFLVGVILKGQHGSAAQVEEHLDELAQLADSAGSRVVGRAVQARQAPDAATFIGKGKAAEIGAAAMALAADLLLFDDDLSAGQVKALEEATSLAVLDRSGLILEIFDQRAKSREARTQVELARLNYLLPRLTKRWSHLSRQAGGVGTRGGEGEKQLEQDRRVLRARIRRLEEDLARIDRTRGVQRHGRRGVPVVALTGYTNAGKSTLFNRLTAADALAEDRLFATLDAKLRRGNLGPHGAPGVGGGAAGVGGGAAGSGRGGGGSPDGRGDVAGANGGRGRSAIFADTVGFIRKLPHHLVSSFRSTLGEITAADLVLHVVDRSHPQWHEQMRVADEVLDELGVERRRVVTIFNKCDRIAAHPGHQAQDGEGLRVSALTGDGIDALRAEIARRLPALAGGAAGVGRGSRGASGAGGEVGARVADK
ncbi:MAG TPA: GTPase HflX, partial [Thermoanaerobaculia bacterium]|nr:GTPase HflX [Thermoanaerobaculia bacterium]